MKKFLWKVWLRLNPLTKDVENDYIAEVSTVGNTIKNEDIARLIVESGSEIKYDTILNILNRSDRIVIENLQKGNSVQTGFCHMLPRVLGAWIGNLTHFNPEKHKITLDMTPTNEMRDALKEVGIEVLGIRESGAFISMVTDVATGKTDGTITPNDDIIIEGDKIKIAPDNADNVGVFFTREGQIDVRVRHPFLENMPKKLIIRVPDLERDEYTLKIVTRYANGNTLLNSPRTIVYNTKLFVR